MRCLEVDTQSTLLQLLVTACQSLQDAGNSSDSAYSHDMTWNSLFHHQPMQQHHAGYKFMLSKQQRQRGISHYGSAERLRAALSRAITSEGAWGMRLHL